MVSSYPTSTSFPQVDGWSTDPRVLGVTKITLPKSQHTICLQFFCSFSFPLCDISSLQLYTLGVCLTSMFDKYPVSLKCSM